MTSAQISLQVAVKKSQGVDGIYSTTGKKQDVSDNTASLPPRRLVWSSPEMGPVLTTEFR